MRIGASGASSVKSLQGSEAMLGAGSLEAATALASLCLDELQLAVKGMNLGRDVEDACVRLVIASDLCCQTPVVRAAGQIHGLVVGRRLPTDGIDEPHWKWLSGGIADVGGGSV